MRFVSKVLKDTLHERFPDATEDELLKVSDLISCCCVCDVLPSSCFGSAVWVEAYTMFHSHVGIFHFMSPAVRDCPPLPLLLSGCRVNCRGVGLEKKAKNRTKVFLERRKERPLGSGAPEMEEGGQQHICI